MSRRARLLSKLGVALSVMMAVVWIGIAVWAAGDPTERRGLPAGRLDTGSNVYFFELTAHWTGYDLRAVYRCSTVMFSGSIRIPPDRSITLWPFLGLALVYPSWLFIHHKTRQRHGFPVEASPTTRPCRQYPLVHQPRGHVLDPPGFVTD